MTRSLGFAACLLALAVIPAPGHDKSTTPLRNFTTLQVEDVRIAPELAHLRFGIPPGTASGSEATEAIRRNIVEEVKGQHMFHRVTDVEKPETVTPETEPDDVQVKPEIAYGQGLNSRFRRRADVEDAKVPKPAAERILLLRCEIVEHQPPLKRKRNLLLGNLGQRGVLSSTTRSRPAVSWWTRPTEVWCGSFRRGARCT